MADVVPLRPDPRGRVRAAPVVSAPSNQRPAARRTREPDGIADDSTLVADFAAPGVDRREIRRLKRGEHVAADRHDLHGMTAAEASAIVKQFIDSSRHKHYRCVCIVHGRGIHSIGNTPVLKTRVREWLRSNPSVLAYADAPASDGGPGAAYVLLRR
jgi:DNA-nicking Smr family endonuclease